MTAFRERRYLSQDGLSLYYRDYGDPLASTTPLLCLPGLTRNSKDFHRLAKRLAPQRRVICPDYRGRGRSDYDPDAANYHPMVHLGDIRHLMVVEGLHRIVVIGTSFGGFLAMGLGVMAPPAIAAVVLNDVGPEVSPGGRTRIMNYVGKDRLLPDWDSAVVEMKRLFPSLSFETDEEWRAAARGTWREGPDGMLHFDWDPRLARTVRRASRSTDPWTVFKSLGHIPLLVLRGALSDVLGEETVARMAQEHPGLKMAVIPDSGHPPSLSEPKSVEALDEFLATF